MTLYRYWTFNIHDIVSILEDEDSFKDFCREEEKECHEEQGGIGRVILCGMEDPLLHPHGESHDAPYLIRDTSVSGGSFHATGYAVRDRLDAVAHAVLHRLMRVKAMLTCVPSVTMVPTSLHEVADGTSN